jgi:putative aldouronate transport system permease protein
VKIIRVEKKKRHYAYIIALPALVIIFILRMIPAFNGIILAFKDYEITRSLSESQWVGFSNFKRLFENQAFTILKRKAHAFSHWDESVGFEKVLKSI